MWGAPRKGLSGPERLYRYGALLLMNGWVEEWWAARGCGGGEAMGIMEPTEAAARKGVEQALPPLSPPSDQLL